MQTKLKNERKIKLIAVFYETQLEGNIWRNGGLISFIKGNVYTVERAIMWKLVFTSRPFRNAKWLNLSLDSLCHNGLK